MKLALALILALQGKKSTRILFLATFLKNVWNVHFKIRYIHTRSSTYIMWWCLISLEWPVFNSPLVSLCLCEVADPPEELVKKYEGLKTTFLKRAANAYAFLHTFFENLLENTITGGKIKELGEAAKGNDRLQAISKLAQWVSETMPL